MRNLRLALALAGCASVLTAKVVSYAPPAGAVAASDIRLKVDGREVFVHENAVAPFAHFSFSGKARVTVELTPGVSYPAELRFESWGRTYTPEPYRAPIRQVDVRPLRLGIKPLVSGNSLSFDITSPVNLSIEVNGNLRRPLFLFAAPLETEIPKPDGAGVRYFGSGRIYDTGVIELKSNETLYIAGGAVVRGTVAVKNARNVRIAGRGILDGSDPEKARGPMLDIQHSQKVTVEGIVILNRHGWTVVPRYVEDLEFRNIKMIAWDNNSDGIDICGSKRVTVKGSFLRNNDDCIVIKAPRVRYADAQVDATADAAVSNDVDGVEVLDTVLWNAQGGNGMEIGFELQTPLVRNIAFRRCDIIHVEDGAAFSIHNGDSAIVRDVIFEDIVVEDAKSELIDIYIAMSIYSGDAPERFHRSNAKRVPVPMELRAEKTGDHSGQWIRLTGEDERNTRKNRGKIENIVFRNITVLGDSKPVSRIVGYDKEYAVRTVAIENLRMGNKPVTDLTAAGFIIREAFGVTVR